MNKNYEWSYKILYYPEADIKNYNLNYVGKFTKEDLPTDESYTLVCEGAGVKCSNHIKIVDYYSPGGRELPGPGFTLKVLKPQARFMGIELMASELDHYPENFYLRDQLVTCKKTKKKCEIKPEVWKNTSNKIFFNGYAALITEKSTIKCSVDQSAEISIATNGQDISRSDTEWTKFWDSIGERPNHSYVGKTVWGGLKVTGGVSQITAGYGLCSSVVGCVFGWALITNGGINVVDGSRDFTSGITTFFSDENVDTQKVLLDNTVGKVFTPETSNSLNNFLDDTYRINGYVSIALTPLKIQYDEALRQSMAAGASNIMNKAEYAKVMNNAGAQQNWKHYEKLVKSTPSEVKIMENDLSFLALSGVAEDQANSLLEAKTKTMDSLTTQERFDLVLERENDWYIEVITGN